MLFIKSLFIFIYLFLSFGCQIGYLIRSSYDHLSMLSSRVSIAEALVSDKLNGDQKKKIELSQEVRQFSFDILKLKQSDNYTHFVQLDRNYITYAVLAASKWKFEPYLWNFPFIGKAPYKGFYDEASAKKEAEFMKSKNFDTYVRGVTAYSTLGKLNDPLLSSMLNYKDHDLVNTVIHELVHTTLFIKDNIDFNERLAVFVAGKGTELFYLKRDGVNSNTLKIIQDENEDDRLFSEFITAELNDLKIWYETFQPSGVLSSDDKEKIRQERFDILRKSFNLKLKPKLKTKSYYSFADGPMNNARLSGLQTYMKDLQDFEKVYIKSGSQIDLFLEKCKKLNDVDDPELELKKWASELNKI